MAAGKQKKNKITQQRRKRGQNRKTDFHGYNKFKRFVRAGGAKHSWGDGEKQLLTTMYIINIPLDPRRRLQ